MLEASELGGGVIALPKLRVIDPEALEPSVIRMVNGTDLKVVAVYNMLMSVVLEANQASIINASPPVFARALNEMHVGYQKYEEAKKMAYLPFPFPYAQVTVWMMFLHLLATPFMAASMCLGYVQAFGITFLLAFVFWSLHEVSIELENPFGTDINDLDMDAYQEFCNQRLLLLLHQAAERAPDIRTDVALSELKNNTGRGKKLSLLKAGVTRPLECDDLDVSDGSTSDLDDERPKLGLRQVSSEGL